MGDKLHAFTAGPWRVDTCCGVPQVIAHCFPKGATCVAVVYGDGDNKQVMARIPDGPEPAEPNACLISAAPDLFAALQRMLDVHQAAMDAAQSSSSKIVHKPCQCGACDEARAAIERALGQRALVA